MVCKFTRHPFIFKPLTFTQNIYLSKYHQQNIVIYGQKEFGSGLYVKILFLSMGTLAFFLWKCIEVIFLKQENQTWTHKTLVWSPIILIRKLKLIWNKISWQKKCMLMWQKIKSRSNESNWDHENRFFLRQTILSFTVTIIRANRLTRLFVGSFSRARDSHSIKYVFLH